MHTASRTWTAGARLLAGTGTAALLLAGCAPAPVSGETGGQAQLAGTAWRLASYRAGDAGTAELRPDRPDQFQLRFGADGRLSVRIDCNQGSGTWTATPAGGAPGSLALGPIATTRMMCPPAPLAGQLSRDLDAVRSYRIVDGRLHLALGNGSGVYTWERAQP